MHILGQNTISFINHTSMLFHSVQLNFYKNEIIIIKKIQTRSKLTTYVKEKQLNEVVIGCV